MSPRCGRVSTRCPYKVDVSPKMWTGSARGGLCLHRAGTPFGAAEIQIGCKNSVFLPPNSSKPLLVYFRALKEDGRQGAVSSGLRKCDWSSVKEVS